MRLTTMLVGAGCAAGLLGGMLTTGLGSTASAATSPTVSDARVGSFNLAGVNTDAQASGDHRVWRVRRPVVVHQILGTKLDVVGLQEANQSTIYKANLDYGVNQYMDLKGALNANGGHWALTNEKAYNCANPSSTYKCVYTNQNASNDTRIIYNTDTVAMVDQGSIQYTTQTAGKNIRFLVWATFRQKATGKEFLFTTTHLDPYSEATRKAQWGELISDVNGLKGSLPVVTTGDFNTTKFDDNAATYLPQMKSNGYGDVMNQVYNSPRSQTRAEWMRRAWVNSFDAYRRNVKTFSYSTDRTKVGNGIDWIFASNNLRVREWAVVMNLDPSTMQLTGVLPSDHSLVRATVVLP